MAKVPPFTTPAPGEKQPGIGLPPGPPPVPAPLDGERIIVASTGQRLMNDGGTQRNHDRQGNGCCPGEPGIDCEYCPSGTPLRLRATFSAVRVCTECQFDPPYAGGVRFSLMSGSVNASYICEQTSGDPCVWQFGPTDTGLTIRRTIYTASDCSGTPAGSNDGTATEVVIHRAVGNIWQVWYYPGGFAPFRADSDPIEDCWVPWAAPGLVYCDQPYLHPVGGGVISVEPV